MATQKVIQMPAASWRDQLRYTGTGDNRHIVPNLANATLVLADCPIWKNSIKYDSFRHKIVVTGELPITAFIGSTWNDNYDIQTARWFQVNDIEITSYTAKEAVNWVAHRNSFNPLHEYLQNLQWDGESRIYSWLHKYCGVPNTQYTRAIGRKWLIAAVARAMNPGCKVQNVLVLEGAQGKRKSMVFEILGGEFYSVLDIGLGGKGAAELLDGVWIAELAEMESLNKSSTGAAKSFFTKDEDHYRPAYGKYAITVKRSTIFGGTVNEDEYLKDHTGGRRIWPALVGEINLNRLRRDRDQLWAEAFLEYYERLAKEEDFIWWLDSTEESFAKVEQSTRYEADHWYDDVRIWLADKQHVSATEVLSQCLKINQDHPKYDSYVNRVGRCLKFLNWNLYRDVAGRRRYKRPDAAAAKKQ